MTTFPVLPSDEKDLIKIVFVINQLSRALSAGGDPIPGVRTPLTADRNYYVATTGSDSNTGLSASTPFLTVQKGLDVAFGSLDLKGFNCTINVAAGTYTQNLNVVAPQVGAGVITILGDNTTPSNVVLSAATSGALLTVQRNALLRVAGLKFQNTHSPGYGLYAPLSGIIFCNSTDKLEFGACTGGAQMFVTSFGTIDISNIAYTISGDAVQHALVQTNGAIRISGCTATIGSARTYTTFCYCSNVGVIEGSNWAATGAGVAGTTGKRYDVSYNATIFSNGGGPNAFPGNAAGTATTGGQYN